MKNKKNKVPVAPLDEKEIKSLEKIENEKFMFTAYPIFPPGDDIYNKDKKVELTPEETLKMKENHENQVSKTKQGKNN